MKICRRSPRGNVDWNIISFADKACAIAVVPHEGTWIEMGLSHWLYPAWAVVPHEGTWIEITYVQTYCNAIKSFPTRERGLKSAQYGTNVYNAASFPTRERGLKLKPLYRFRCTDTSFPTRERGLKLPSIASLLSGSSRRSPRGNVDWNNVKCGNYFRILVVPHEGTWIEISTMV